MKLSLSFVVLAVVALFQVAQAAPQKNHSLSMKVFKGTSDRPAFNLKYNFKPNDDFNVNVGATHTIGGGTSVDAGLTWRFRRDAEPQKHSLSTNISKGTGGNPAVGLKYDYIPNDNFNFNIGATHTISGGTKYGAGFTWRFRRDARMQRK